MRSLGRAVAILALLGATAAWGQEAPNDSPSVSAGWQRVESATAVGGACYMTKNRLKATSQAATWSLQVPAGGDYRIQVYVPPVDNQLPRTRNATYVISRGHGVLIKAGINQALGGWQSIGNFNLAKGPMSVSLVDRTTEPDGSHMVVANAVRLVLSSVAPGYGAMLASTDLTRSGVAGDVVPVNIQLTNTGQQTWYRDPAGTGQVPVRLALDQGPAPFCANIAAWDPGFGWLPRSRERVVMDTPQVAPGQTGSFLFSVQLAQNLTPGAYVYRFLPVAEPTGAPGGGVMNSEITLTINVTAQPQNLLDYTGLQLYRSNLSAFTSDSDGDKLIDLFLPTDRSPAGALAYSKTKVNVLGLTDHGEDLNSTKWAGQADATAAATATTAGSPFFVGLRGFMWTGTTGPHDFFGYPWEGASTDDGQLSIFGTSTWTGTRAVKDGAPPQLTPFFFGAAAPSTALTGMPTNLADWLWVNGYPRPNSLDNGVSPAQFNHPSLFFRSNFFKQFLYQPDMDRFFNLLEVGGGEVRPGYVQAELQKGAANLADQISEEGGYRYLGPDTPASVANHPPDELLSLPPAVLAVLGHPEDMSKWGTNPNNMNRSWFETALHNGWHVAPSINGDNHAGCYCDESGYTGVWAKSVAGMTAAQAQAAVLQGIRERAVFASDDPGLSAQFSVFSGGTQYRMGQRNVPLSGSPRFRLDLTSAAFGGNPAGVAVQDVFLVTNDGPVRIGGSLTGPFQRIETSLPITISSTTQERFFYALVVSKRTGDRGENLHLLTAPIWMVPCCPPPTCMIWPTEAQVPAGACTVLGFSSDNATTATLSIDGGAPISVPTTGTRTIFPSDLSSNTALHLVTFRVTGPCGSSVCSVQISCGPVVQGEMGQCIVNVLPQSGDCSTPFTATWQSSGIFNTHLLLDGADLGAVPATGSLALPSSGSGTHVVKLTGTSGGAATSCQASFTVSPSGQFPSCRNSVLPSAGFLNTQFDLCFFAGNANRVDVFVDGVLECTQLNPIAGQRYNCFVLGSQVGPGIHVATIIATGCGGTCSSGTPFRVFSSNTPSGTDPGSGGGLTGTPGEQIMPKQLSFGKLNVGSTSGPMSFTIHNAGTAPLTIFSISLSGADLGDFQITSGGDSGTLNPNDTRTVMITFTPMGAGPRSASVTVSSNAASSPESVMLTGTGMSILPPPPSGPSVTSVHCPASGEPNPGRITITGMHFGAMQGSSTVTVTGPTFTSPTTAAVLMWSDTMIVVQAPTDNNGVPFVNESDIYHVMVTVGGQSATGDINTTNCGPA
jgi:hypothetical protein